MTCPGVGSFTGHCKEEIRSGWKLCTYCLAVDLGEAYAIVNSLLSEQTDEVDAFNQASEFFEDYGK